MIWILIFHYLHLLLVCLEQKEDNRMPDTSLKIFFPLSELFIYFYFFDFKGISR